MTKLLWDAIGERRFETGVDRGVLYPDSGPGVAWNGLTGVNDEAGDANVQSYYYDGIKYLDVRSNTDYSGLLNAYTYPDEFMEYDGTLAMSTGMLATHQPVTKLFGLSYRTRVGDDVLGPDLGYKIHLLYNLTANPTDQNHSSIGASVTLTPFSWRIVGVPVAIPGFRPTVHIILDSRASDAAIFAQIEEILYGDDLNDPRLPTIEELLALDVSFEYSIDITDLGNGQWTATGPPDNVELLDSVTLQITGADANFLAGGESYQISTTPL